MNEVEEIELSEMEDSTQFSTRKMLNDPVLDELSRSQRREAAAESED